MRRAPRVSPCASTSLHFNLDFKSFTLLPIILCALTTYTSSGVIHIDRVERMSWLFSPGREPSPTITEGEQRETRHDIRGLPHSDALASLEEGHASSTALSPPSAVAPGASMVPTSQASTIPRPDGPPTAGERGDSVTSWQEKNRKSRNVMEYVAGGRRSEGYYQHPNRQRHHDRPRRNSWGDARGQPPHLHSHKHKHPREDSQTTSSGASGGGEGGGSGDGMGPSGGSTGSLSALGKIGRHVSQSFQMSLDIVKTHLGEELVFCQVCREYERVSKTYRLGACGHRYCRGCVTSYLECKISEGQIHPTCFYSEENGRAGREDRRYRTIPRPCATPVLESDMYTLVCPETWLKYERFKFQKAHRNARMCPFCDSAELGDAEQPAMTCSKCGKQFCYFHASAHPNKSCTEYEQLTHEETLRNQAMISTIAKVGGRANEGGPWAWAC